VLALLAGLAVRAAFADCFDEAHLAIVAARPDKGHTLGHEVVLRDAVTRAGLAADAVAAVVWSGRPLATLAAEHTEAVDRWGVWGVPTFIEGEDAAFVRFMERGRVDDLDRTVDLLGWTRLNEFKRPRVDR
jgi:2-hydroxychromene-2-carboxylate isomerase